MNEIVIRECLTIAELDDCVRLQRDVFGLPDLEISPRRHLIVSRQAGGWTLGAFATDRLVGFVHHLAAIRGTEVFGYSHMMAVEREYQNKGVGARLKWSQRERALLEGRNFIRWTWDPMQARNAHFNLNRLGVIVGEYAANFYGTDYPLSPAGKDGLDSDRLFAAWQIRTERVARLAPGTAKPTELNQSAAATEIEIPADWGGIVKHDRAAAHAEQMRVRKEFERAFAEGLICAGFARDEERPRYLLFEKQAVSFAGL